MISKKKLRERMWDICAGAGLNWVEDDGYWNDYNLEYFGNMVTGVELVFGLKENNRLRCPWNWKEFDNFDSLVDLVYEAIQYDSE